MLPLLMTNVTTFSNQNKNTNPVKYMSIVLSIFSAKSLQQKLCDDTEEGGKEEKSKATWHKSCTTGLQSNLMMILFVPILTNKNIGSESGLDAFYFQTNCSLKSRNIHHVCRYLCFHCLVFCTFSRHWSSRC